MAGVDAAAWVESFKDYLEPVTKIALDVKDKVSKSTSCSLLAPWRVHLAVLLLFGYLVRWPCFSFFLVSFRASLSAAGGKRAEECVSVSNEFRNVRTPARLVGCLSVDIDVKAAAVHRFPFPILTWREMRYEVARRVCRAVG